MKTIEVKKEVLEGEEKFEKWDDYMEWKAYENTCKDRLSQLKDMKNAKNIRLEKVLKSIEKKLGEKQ